MGPWLVIMLTLTFAGSVGTFPLRGGSTFLAAGSGLAGYWQLAPRSAGALNAGNTPACPGGGGVVGAAEVDVDADAVLVDPLSQKTFHTTSPATTMTTAIRPAMAKTRLRRACFARRSSCRCNLRWAVARRCLLVGTSLSSSTPGACSSPLMAPECAMQH